MHPRIRTIKPEFFKHEGLFDLEQETGLPIRMAFAGMFTIADREGRFKWRPRTIKSYVLPHDQIDFSRVLHALWSRGFLVVYANSGEFFGVIPTFKAHQVINNKEKASELPSQDDPESKIVSDLSHILTREPRVTDAYLSSLGKDQVERKGKERKGKELVVVGQTENSTREPRVTDASTAAAAADQMEVAGEPKEQPPATVPDKSFTVIDELAWPDNPLFEQVISQIPDDTQKSWVNRYDNGWLKTSLADAIEHHIGTDRLKAAQIDDWGRRLTRWLRNEKKPILANGSAKSGASTESLEQQKEHEREEWKFVQGSDFNEEEFERWWNSREVTQ